MFLQVRAVDQMVSQLGTGHLNHLEPVGAAHRMIHRWGDYDNMDTSTLKVAIFWRSQELCTTQHPFQGIPEASFSKLPIELEEAGQAAPEQGFQLGSDLGRLPRGSALFLPWVLKLLV